MRTIDQLVARGSQVILVDRPIGPPGVELVKQARAAQQRGEPIDQIRAPITPRDESYLLNRVARKHPRVLIIRPWEAICDSESCAVAIDGVLLYRTTDGSHLEHAGSRALGERYLKLKGNPLRNLLPKP